MYGNKFAVKIFGTRGSSPVAAYDKMMYGGNTSCVAVYAGEKLLVLDCGTGAIDLGEEILNNDISDVHMLISHVHVDHIQGIPFFAPMSEPEVSVCIYGEIRCGMSMEEQISMIMKEPLWPMTTDSFKASVAYKDIEVGKTFYIGERVAVSTMSSCHPNNSTIYKIMYEDKIFVYAIDYEHCAKWNELVEFARDCDLIIYDAHFTSDEYYGIGGKTKIGWGHSTWQRGLKMAEECNAKCLLMTHHSPQRKDSELISIEKEIIEKKCVCRFAREKEVILL